MPLYMGLDVGGTYIKGAVIDEKGNEYCTDMQPTILSRGIVGSIVAIYKRLSEKSGKTDGLGIGCAGVINSQEGKVVLAKNLQLENFPLAREVEKIIGVPVKITNDANAAALGEAKFGVGKNYKNSILITLGTGVGGGIVIDGKLFEGNKSAGAEIGHMVIERGGEMCNCGRRGCFEAYSSATALKRMTVRAMQEDAGSAMWEKYTPSTVTGKTAFEYKDRDVTAKEVVDKYINYLACGIANLANIFRPEIIMLGGGVSKEGDRLTIPLKKILKDEIFAFDYAPVEIEVATLPLAGAYGAAALNI